MCCSLQAQVDEYKQLKDSLNRVQPQHPVVQAADVQAHVPDEHDHHENAVEDHREQLVHEHQPPQDEQHQPRVTSRSLE